jgi:hypothetical protein
VVGEVLHRSADGWEVPLASAENPSPAARAVIIGGGRGQSNDNYDRKSLY